MKIPTLDETPLLTDEQIAGYLDLCRRNPDNSLVWGNRTVGAIILSLQRKILDTQAIAIDRGNKILEMQIEKREVGGSNE